MKTMIFDYLSLFSLSIYSQTKDEFYPLNATWNSTSSDSGVYLLWVHQLDDGNSQWTFYNMWGPIIKTEAFADKGGTVQNGSFCIYNKAGTMNSVGAFDHGKKQGRFYKLRTFREDSIRYIMQYDYNQDSLVKTIDRLSADRKEYEDENSVSKESEYPGGIKRWQAYLMNKLDYPQPALKNEIQGQVVVNFVVDETGRVQNPMVGKSREFSLDQEAIRIVRQSGKWIPARENVANIKSYKSQPINFKLSN